MILKNDFHAFQQKKQLNPLQINYSALAFNEEQEDG
jgi:hypothetical protein